MNPDREIMSIALKLLTDILPHFGKRSKLHARIKNCSGRLSGRIEATEYIADARVETICEIVRNKFDIDPEIFYNKVKCRTRSAVDARHIAIYLMHKHIYRPQFLHGWTSMAKVFNTEHATMIHSVNKIKGLIQFDTVMKLLIQSIEDEIRNKIENPEKSV